MSRPSRPSIAAWIAVRVWPSSRRSQVKGKTATWKRRPSSAARVSHAAVSLSSKARLAPSFQQRFGCSQSDVTRASGHEGRAPVQIFVVPSATSSRVSRSRPGFPWRVYPWETDHSALKTTIRRARILVPCRSTWDRYSGISWIKSRPLRQDLVSPRTNSDRHR